MNSFDYLLFLISGATYWFHGTDHNSALNIIREGIDLGKGKAAGDFSDGDGFYLTSNFQFAKEWPVKMMRKPTTAVIIFKVDPNLFSNYQGATCQDADEEWESMVRYFRNGKDSSACRKKKSSKFKRLQYVFGPISRDGSNAKSACRKPKPRDPLMFELCLRDNFLVEDFHDEGRNIERVIFFHSE